MLSCGHVTVIFALWQMQAQASGGSPSQRQSAHFGHSRLPSRPCCVLAAPMSTCCACTTSAQGRAGYLFIAVFFIIFLGVVIVIIVVVIIVIIISCPLTLTSLA